MKNRAKLTDDPEKKTKSKHAAVKVLRTQRRKAYYAMQPARTLTNKKRTLARHLRHFPEDTQAAKLCAERYSVTFAGQAVAAATGKAQARAKARARRRAKIARTVAAVVAADTAIGLHTFTIEPPAYAPFT